MLARLLLDDAASTEGNGTESKPAEVVAAVPDPNKVTLNKSDLDTLKAELDGFRTKEAEATKAARDAEEAKAREKGEYDKLLKNREADVLAAQKRADDKDAENRRILTDAATAIAERDLIAALPDNLVAGGKAQLLRLFRDDLEAKQENGSFATKARDGRSVPDYIKAQLALPEFAHFIVAKTGGGANSNGNTATPTNREEKQPQTEGERMTARRLAGRIDGPAFSGKYANSSN